MKPYFISEIEKFLPLEISRAIFESEQFNIGSEYWSFNSNSGWRVVSDKGLEFSSYSDNLEFMVESLVGVKVVSVKSNDTANLDPIFILSDGRAIEVFTTQYLDPWVIRLPNKEIIVSDAQTN